MEVQTFLLCNNLAKIGPGCVYDAKMIGMHSFFAKDERFPLDCELPYFMLVRRSDRGTDVEISFRFNLVDKDGRAVGEPNNVRAKSVFPSGHRFMVFAGKMKLVFPAIGDYRLDITADEGKIPATFQYDIEVTPRP